MHALRELSGSIPVPSLSLKLILAVAICLSLLVRKTQNSSLRPKHLKLNMVVVEALDIQSLDGPSLVDSRFADFEMD